MSKPITLSVGNIDLTYDTGHVGMDHGMPFQEGDRRRRRHASINYDYYEQHPRENIVQREMCFCRTLGSMVSRLGLFGYTLSAVKADYELQSTLDGDLYTDPEAGGTPARPDRLTFDQFVAFIRSHAVRDLNDEYDDDNDAKHLQGQGRFASEPAVALLPEGDPDRDMGGYSERSHVGALLGFLNPYSALRILAENAANLDLEVVWDYGNFVDAGWAENSDSSQADVAPKHI